MKIYVNLGNVTNFSQDNGDRINEVCLYMVMSKFADVYYNEQLFNPKKKNFGITLNRKISIPKEKYDFYYVRFNPKLFLKLPRPKAYLGTPYDERCFKNADAIVTYTESWRKQLLNYKKVKTLGLYSEDIFVPKDVITFNQAVTDDFQPRRGHKKTLEYRKRFGGDFIIAHFGRISKGTYPHSLLYILPKLRAMHPNVNITFIHAGKIKKVNLKKIKSIPYIKHSDMPYAISACDVIVCNSRQAAANWAGCKDVLEAMACGIPILTGDYNVRKEQLGKEYELFWPNKVPNKGRISEKAEECMLKHLSNLIKSKKYRQEISNKLLERSKKYSIDNVSKKMKRDIEKLINLKK